MTPQRFHLGIAFEKDTPAVGPGVTDETSCFWSVVIKLDKVGRHELKFWCDGATEQAGVL
jgi:hypothetical protein